MFQQDGTPAHRPRDTVAFLERDRETRETRRRLSACVRVRGTFRARILTILSRSVMTTITLLNKPYFSLLCQIRSSESLLQIIHFNVM